MISTKPDPFLNEVNSFEDLQMEFEELNDCEDYQLDFDNSVELLHNVKKKTCYKGSFDAFSAFIEEIEMPKAGKYNVLDREKDNNLYIELVQQEDVLKLLIRRDTGNEIIPFHCIPPAEVGGQIKHPFIRQAIESITKVELAPKLNMFLPKIQAEQGLKVFLCPVQQCNMGFIKMTTARTHSLMHLKIKPYKCKQENCKWAFYTPFKLRRHEETHAKRKDYICPIEGCNRRFTTIYNLNGHKRTHARPADLPCFVEECEEKFQTTKARQQHMKTHCRSEGSFRCEESNCNKKFFTETALLTHQKLHTHKASDLVCSWPNCGKVFEQPYRLKEHKRVHTGQRPYHCSFGDCKWSFSTASKLKRHQVTHTNERKFHCTIGNCSKSFMRSEHLKHHTLTHIGQRTFICEGNLFKRLPKSLFGALTMFATFPNYRNRKFCCQIMCFCSLQ